jgi:uncharacterized protein (TIGR03118 family)
MRSLTRRTAHAAILTASILATATVGRAGGFAETDLVANKSPLIDSNKLSHTPAHVDPNLLNPWGLTASGTSPFWVSDNNAGVSTLYNNAGVAQSLVVSIPGPPPKDPLGKDGTPTGVVFNIAQAAGAFKISKGSVSAPAVFLFATEDGTILGWNPAVDPTHAIIAVPKSGVQPSEVYKGLAIAIDSLGTIRLYATNFKKGTVDVFDTNFNPATPVDAFADPKLLRGYAPFNIVPIGTGSGQASAEKLVVTYAVQDAAAHDDVAGMSHGIVNTFDPSGHLLQRLIRHGQLNSPWGVAVAPTSFGALTGALLIGNFGNGQINAYNATTGEFIDKMRNPQGQAIVIDGLWSLRVGSATAGANFGPDKVFFAAGPNGEQDGLFGTITPNP